MTVKTLEIELTPENSIAVLALIDRANHLSDELKSLQEKVKIEGQTKRELNLLHDELDAVRDYREITLERIALLTLGDQSQVEEPVGTLGVLDDEDDAEEGGK